LTFCLALGNDEGSAHHRDDWKAVNPEVNMEVNERVLSPPFPGETCLICRAVLSEERGVCADCLRDLPFIKTSCYTCGIPLPHPGICGDCLIKPIPLDRTVSAFEYRYPVDGLIKKIKYSQALNLIPPLSHILAARITRAGPLPEAIIPVPLHPIRLFLRGFNQSAEICKCLNRILDLKYRPRTVNRVRNTLPMFGLSPVDRSINVQGAFELQKIPDFSSVAIVDDVMTSGATAKELSGLLKSAGVAQVDLWSLARA
jgi:ComF family protein